VKMITRVRGGGAAFLEQRGFQGRVAGVAGYPGASGAMGLSAASLLLYSSIQIFQQQHTSDHLLFFLPLSFSELPSILLFHQKMKNKNSKRKEKGKERKEKNRPLVKI